MRTYAASGYECVLRRNSGIEIEARLLVYLKPCTSFLSHQKETRPRSTFLRSEGDDTRKIARLCLQRVVADRAARIRQRVIQHQIRVAAELSRSTVRR
jgi:hypothetical protein